MTRKINVVVLAAGKGTRMKSDLPKVLHRLAGQSLLQHNLDLALALGAERVNVVIGHGADLIRDSIDHKGITFTLQEEQLGTGHAVAQTIDELDDHATALVLYGDVPMLQEDTVRDLIEMTSENKMAVLTCIVADPSGLGRILRNKDGRIEAIIEEKDAEPEQRKIQEINSGIMAIPVKRLREWLPKLGDDNAQNEYYLTDVIALANETGCDVGAKVCQDPLEVMGVNNRLQLAQLERHYQHRQAEKLMLAGVTLADPARLDIRGDVSIGQDVEIDVNVILAGRVEIAEKVIIGPNCYIKDCRIGPGTVIKANSHLEDAIIGTNCEVGPFARVRPGTEMADAARIGNFVETKKSYIGKGSKVNHLSYIGDSELGEGVNVGAGTITCNYDGINKHKTIIGDGAFIGSNTALVAPVRIGSRATVGAGSTISRDVPDGTLGLTRAKQQIISDWPGPAAKSAAGKKDSKGNKQNKDGKSSNKGSRNKGSGKKD